MPQGSTLIADSPSSPPGYPAPRLRRIFLALTALLAALAILAGCSPAAAPENPAGPAETLRLALVEQPVTALVHVAEAKGFFRAEGLAISYSTFALGRDALAAAIDGKADLAAVFDLPVATRIYEGQDLTILSTLHVSTRGHGLLARRDRGIARPADLRGKRIGLTKGITSDYFLSVFLAGEGIASTQVSEVPLEPEEYEAALAGGKVDALVVYNSPLSDLRKKFGAEATVVFHTDAYQQSSLLAGRRAVVERKAEATRRLARALVRAEDFMKRNREESIGIVAARLAARFPEGAIREALEAMVPEARLGHVLLTTLTQEGHWLRDSGRFQTPVPDYSQAILRDPLTRADPGAVTLLAETAPR